MMPIRIFEECNKKGKSKNKCVCIKRCHSPYTSLPHSSKDVYREVLIDVPEKEKIIIYQMEDEIYEDYSLSVNHFSKDLEIGCNHIDVDLEDNLINRKMKLNKKAALYLVKDLIKYIITGKI